MTAVKGQRMNPNSLANLKMFKKGDVPNKNGAHGPLITPAMRRYSTWTYADLKALTQSEKALSLPVGDAIAITMLLKAAEAVEWSGSGCGTDVCDLAEIPCDPDDRGCQAQAALDAMMTGGER